MEYTKRYNNLNTNQKEAVDAIDGPVMVIAGPGTGKTELLGVRVANILQKTDTLPENILCLTFTDSGASAMRERLTEIIGKEAYKVSIHTFHSFGSEVINQNGQYFYRGANFRAADKLSSYEIIRKIFEELDHNNPLNGMQNGEYTHLSDCLTTISELKKSGLTNDELLVILDENNIVIEGVEQLLASIFAEKISKKTTEKLSSRLEQIRALEYVPQINTIVPLSDVISDSLEYALNEAIGTNSTKPVTAWRNQWFKKDLNNKFILKSHERQVKLRAISFIYSQYLDRMQEASLYDFDDMILRVVHAMEVFDELRFNLQEKYQYIMVDEFQDTNMAQMRILHNLTNNVMHDDTPNIMVVGDDDQAIYSFQGADISNIIDFRTNYPKSKIVTLTDNYRSASDILTGSRNIIVQGSNRLENKFNDVNKELVAQKIDAKSQVQINEFESIESERSYIAKSVKSLIEQGRVPNEIAILTRRHQEINDLLPYFYDQQIPVNYERSDNVLEQPLILLIEQISKLLINISRCNYDEVNAALPELLSHKVWDIAPIEFWKFGLKAYEQHIRWLDLLAITPEYISIYDWFITTASLINDTPLEQVLDIIIGNHEQSDDKYKSPIYDYYFSKEQLDTNPDDYLIYLESLRTIRSKMRDYKPNESHSLTTFIDFISLNRQINSTISIARPALRESNAVNIMTAHKSKGLEFDTVFVMNAVDNVWGEGARSRNRLISYPENLPLAPAGESSDERLRLFYVAITRAKNNLHISYSDNNDSGKKTLCASFLIDSKWQVNKIEAPSNQEEQIKAAELAWYQPIIKPVTSKMHDLLLPTLENYKLSVTHLNNFLDTSRGGPETFLLNNLLRFPQAKSSSAAYGTAIHETIQQAHDHISSGNSSQAIEDIISNYEKILTSQYLPKQDFEKYIEKGSEALMLYLEKSYPSFNVNQKTELNFGNQNCIIGSAHLSGKLDLVDIDKSSKTVIVTDFKTGKPSLNWSGKTEFEKIKMHKYKQQLMFYKLLVENARDFRDYKVESGIMQFIEPTPDGNIISLEANFDQNELDKFKLLIESVWYHITNLNLPDISSYSPTIKGVIYFENDLIDKVI